MKVATFLYKISLCFSQDMVGNWGEIVREIMGTWWKYGGKLRGNYGDMMEIWWNT